VASFSIVTAPNGRDYAVQSFGPEGPKNPDQSGRNNPFMLLSAARSLLRRNRPRDANAGVTVRPWPSAFKTRKWWTRLATSEGASDEVAVHLIALVEAGKWLPETGDPPLPEALRQSISER
jgi:hypothetical protein